MDFAPPSALEKARQIDLLSYLKAKEPTELVRCGPNVYCTRTHDSLKISNGKWFWWSRGFGGYTALDYLIKVREMRLQDAVELLTGEGCRSLPPIRAAPIEKKKRLLPIRYNSRCRKVKPYLLHRGLDEEIVDEMIAEGRIAEDEENEYALFFGFDDNGIKRECAIRSTDGTAIKKELPGSDKKFAFRLDSQSDSTKIWIFESAIDLLSFATLMKRKGKDYRTENLMSLSGVYMPPSDASKAKVPVALERFLAFHPQVNTVHLCLDNDKAGLLAAEGIATALGDRVTVKRHLPPFGKDWNDYLKSLKYPNQTRKERKENYER